MRKNSKQAKSIAVILLALFLFQTALYDRAAFAAEPPYDFRPYTSGGSLGDFPQEDAAPEGTEPNVLFYIDISGNATVSMKGVAPADYVGSLKGFYENFPDYMEDANNRIEMSKHNTFGLGARPMSGSTLKAQEARLAEAGKPFEPGHVPFEAGIDLGAEENLDSGAYNPLLYERWGRDVDESNNIVGDDNCYYSMDPNKPYMLTFRYLDANGQPVKPDYHDDRYMSNPDIYENPDYFNDYEEMMGYARARIPVPLKLANKYLVPNDSKMYQVKLVLSKILAPTPENMKMHSRMRLGLASTFAEARIKLSGTVIAEPFKNTTPSTKPPYFTAPYNYKPPVNYRHENGEDLYLLRHKRDASRPAGALTYDRSGKTENINGVDFTWENSVQGADLYTLEDGLTYKWFRMPDESHTFPTIGLYRPFNLISSQPFPGVNYLIPSTSYALTTTSVADGAPDPSSALNPLYQRSIMHIPFDFMYTRSGDLYAPSPSLVTFREYIDGVDQFTDPVFTGRPGAPEKIHTNIEFSTSMIPGGIEDLIYDTYLPGGPGGNWRRSSVYPAGPDGDIKYDLDGISEKIITFTDPQFGSRNSRSWQHNRFQRLRNSEGLMTGTVAGTVLNFFSPGKKESDWSYSTAVTPGKYYPDTGPARPGTEKTVYHYQAGVNWSEGSADGRGDTRGYFPVTNGCQGNYVIYFSTGNEFNAGWSASIRDSGKRNMMQSILNIVHESTQMRGRRKDAEGKWVETTHSMDSPIQVFVVGLIDSKGADQDGDPYNESPSYFANQDPVRRARNAMRRMAHAGQPIVSRDAYGAPMWNTMKPNNTKNEFDEYEIQPIFADDVETLLEELYGILNKVGAGRTSSGAPSVMQNAALSDGGDITYFSSSYRGDALRQWDGAFARYTIPKDQKTARLKWEAGAKMKAEADKNQRGNKVFAVLNSSGGPMALGGAGSGVLLADALGMPPLMPQADLFRKWLIDYKTSVNTGGKTVTVEDNGVLGSMEHSSPAFAPKAAPKTVFIQTNRGALHAVDYDSGAEKWTFLPPPAFEHLMWRQKFGKHPSGISGEEWMESWMEGYGKRTRMSQQMMLLDGQISVNETDDGHYLLGALGRGGNGLYAMDVSDEAAGGGAAPDFLWAVDNARYTNNPVSVNTWGAADKAADIAGWEDLGLTIAAPELRRTAFDGYVGVIPGGLPANLGKDENTQGRALFVFNHKTGAIKKKITGSDMGMMVSPVYYITRKPDDDGNGLWTTKEFFTGDSNGNVLFCDAEGPVSGWNLKSIFQVTDSKGNGVLTPYSYSLVKFPGDKRWLFGGTGDITGPERDMVDVDGVKVSRQRGLYNDEQFIYGLRLDKMDIYQSAAAFGMNKLWPLTYYGADGAASDQKDVNDDTNYLGWYLKLAAADSTATPSTKAEYVSVAPYFNEGAGVLYVATFTEYANQVQEPGKCGSTGYSRLYAFDPQTGSAKWDDGKTQSKVFANIKIVGLSSVSRMVNGQMVNTLILAISSPEALDGNANMAENAAYAIDSTNWGIDVKDNSGGLPALVPEVPNLQYWREIF